MERIIGIALSRYLAHYIKNFSASNFKNWSLTDLGAPNQSGARASRRENSS